MPKIKMIEHGKLLLQRSESAKKIIAQSNQLSQEKLNLAVSAALSDRNIQYSAQEREILASLIAPVEEIPMTVLNIRITQDMRQELEKRAYENRRSMSEEARLAIVNYFASQQEVNQT